jgi:invasion protein IalB
MRIVIPYASCGGGFCQAGGRLAPNFTRTLAAAEKASATVVASNGQAVTLQISVNGLAQALSALRQAEPAPADAPAANAPAPAPQQ